MLPVLLAAGSLYDRAERLYSQQQYKEAEPLLQQAVAKHPRSVPVRFLLGATLLKLQRRAQALPELKMANQLNPRHAEAAKLLAREYLRNREPSQAIDVLLTLLRGASPDETVFLLLIQAYESRALPGDVDSARTLVQQGLKRHPRSQVLRSAARRLRPDGK